VSDYDVPNPMPSGSEPETQEAPRTGRVRRAFRLAGGLLFVVILGALGGLYAWLGSFRIEPGEEAIVLRLGKYDRTKGNGLHFYAPGIETLERAWVKNRRMEFGYSTRTRGDSAIAPSEQEVSPLEYEADPDEKRMLTGDANLVDVEFVLEYDIVDLRTFLLNARNAEEIIRDAARAAVREAVAQRTVDSVLRDGRPQVEIDAERRIEILLRSYTRPFRSDSDRGRARPQGSEPEASERPAEETTSTSALGIRVLSLRLQDVDPPEAVREAFRDVTSALQDKERLQLEAQTYRDEIVPKARGEAQRLVAEAEAYRDALVLEAEGEAQRFDLLLTEYQKAPEVTRARLYIETLEAVLPKTEKIIMPNSSGDRVMPYLPLDRRGRGSKAP